MGSVPCGELPSMVQGVDLQGPTHWQELSLQVRVITDKLTGQRPNCPPPPRGSSPWRPRWRAPWRAHRDRGPAGSSSSHGGTCLSEFPGSSPLRLRGAASLTTNCPDWKLEANTGLWGAFKASPWPPRLCLSAHSFLHCAPLTPPGLGPLLTGLTPHLPSVIAFFQETPAQDTLKVS